MEEALFTLIIPIKKEIKPMTKPHTIGKASCLYFELNMEL